MTAEDALAALGLPADITVVNLGTLGKTDGDATYSETQYAVTSAGQTWGIISRSLPPDFPMARVPAGTFTPGELAMMAEGDYSGAESSRQTREASGN